MRLYRIPHPWDYHGQGAIIVMAKNKAEALAKAKAYQGERSSYGTEPKWDEIEEVGGVTTDGGCDC